jgi:hypothetical protein
MDKKKTPGGSEIGVSPNSRKVPKRVVNMAII